MDFVIDKIFLGAHVIWWLERDPASKHGVALRCGGLPMSQPLLIKGLIKGGTMAQTQLR